MALGHRAEIGPFTSKGQELLELVAAGCQLVAVQSSSVDTWVTDPSRRLNCSDDLVAAHYRLTHAGS